LDTKGNTKVKGEKEGNLSKNNSSCNERRIQKGRFFFLLLKKKITK